VAGSTVGPERAWATWLSPITKSRTKGTAASIASNVRALARNGMLFSSAAWRIR